MPVDRGTGRQRHPNEHENEQVRWPNNYRCVDAARAGAGAGGRREARQPRNRIRQRDDRSRPVDC